MGGGWGKLSMTLPKHESKVDSLNGSAAGALKDGFKLVGINLNKAREEVNHFLCQKEREGRWYSNGVCNTQGEKKQHGKEVTFTKQKQQPTTTNLNQPLTRGNATLNQHNTTTPVPSLSPAAYANRSRRAWPASCPACCEWQASPRRRWRAET